MGRLASELALDSPGYSTMTIPELIRDGVNVHVGKSDVDNIRKLYIRDGVIDWADSIDANDVSEFVGQALDSVFSQLSNDVLHD